MRVKDVGRYSYGVGTHNGMTEMYNGADGGAIPYYRQRIKYLIIYIE